MPFDRWTGFSFPIPSLHPDCSPSPPSLPLSCLITCYCIRCTIFLAIPPVEIRLWRLLPGRVCYLFFLFLTRFLSSCRCSLTIPTSMAPEITFDLIFNRFTPTGFILTRLPVTEFIPFSRFCRNKSDCDSSTSFNMLIFDLLLSFFRCDNWSLDINS